MNVSFTTSQITRVSISLIGIAAILAVCIGGYLLLHPRQTTISNDPRQNRPSYYEKSAFNKPPDIQQKEAAHKEQAAQRIRLPIIMYHYVEYVQDPGDFIRKRLDVTPDTFEKELKDLQEAQYETYFVKDIPPLIGGESQLSPKGIVLTFDDGYEDFYAVAFPLLKKYNVKATIYIVNHFIGRKGYMTQKEIEEIIASRLVEVGAHTLDHIGLKGVSKATLEKQIVESKKELEDRFDINISTFAYPYGSFDTAAVSAVQEASFSAAVSVIPGVYHSEESLFYLSRIRPGAFNGTTMIHVLESLNK